MRRLLCSYHNCRERKALTADKLKPVRVLPMLGGSYLVGYPLIRRSLCYYHIKETQGHFNTKDWRERRKKDGRETEVISEEGARHQKQKKISVWRPWS